MIEAVVFDLDGVIVDSEQVWDDVREQLARERGGRWHDRAQADMMGMSSPEWSRYMHDELGLEESPEEINDEVVRRLLERYEADLPLIDGAVEAVRRLAARLPLAVASSSNRPVIDTVLERAGLAALFAATVSSEEVERGKPAPDVYLEAARRLGIGSRAACAAVEDSSNGIRAAAAAGMRVIAIPNRHYPPAPDALALADVVLGSLDGAHGRASSPSRTLTRGHDASPIRSGPALCQDRRDLGVAGGPLGVLERRDAVRCRRCVTSTPPVDQAPHASRRARAPPSPRMTRLEQRGPSDAGRQWSRSHPGCSSEPVDDLRVARDSGGAGWSPVPLQLSVRVDVGARSASMS